MGNVPHNQQSLEESVEEVTSPKPAQEIEGELTALHVAPVFADHPPPSEEAEASVEASLEDFINQANASFPASDGWDLHTGDVELVEEKSGLRALATPDEDKRQHSRAMSAVEPLDVVSVEPEPEAEPLPPMPERRSGPLAVAVTAVAPVIERRAEALPVERRSGQMAAVSTLPPVERRTASLPAVARPSSQPGLPEPRRSGQFSVVQERRADTPTRTSRPTTPTSVPLSTPGDRRSVRVMRAVSGEGLADQLEPLARPSEPTEIVAVPQMMPWSANPKVIIGGIFSAFILGAGLVFAMVKLLMPPMQGPIVVRQPGAMHREVEPQAPIVTPLENVEELPAEAEPAPAVKAVVKRPVRSIVRRPEAVVARATVEKAESKPVEKKAESKPGEKKAAKPAGEWVDPFAQ